MAKHASGSAFDELLTQLADEDKTAFTELAEKYPAVKEYGLRQSDYSRRLDELKAEIDYANRWKQWEKDNYDFEANSTKAEKILRDQLETTRREKEALEQEVFLGEGDMTFAQMEQEFGKIAESKGYVTKDVIAAKENELRAYVDKGISPVLLTAQELQLRHFQEFGEILPGSELLEKAAQAGAGNFKEYYEQSIAGPRRIAADKAKYESELKTQRETYERQLQETKDQAEAEKQRLIGMNATNNPADAGEGNQFREYVQGIKKEEASKIPDIPIGEGGIAAEAARIYKQNGGHF